jgi:hypothetical protein
LGGSIHTIKKNTGASRETGLQENTEKTKSMAMSWDQHKRKNHTIKTNNKSFERLEQSKYLGMTLRNKNSIQEEITSRVKSEDACYQ